MPGAKHLLYAVLGGLVISVAVLAFVLVPRSEQRTVSAASGLRPTYVALVTNETQSRLAESSEVQPRINFVRVNSAEGLRSEVTRLDADGVVLDEITIADLPKGDLGSFFSEGRALVVFGVEKQDVLRLAASNTGFPDADPRFIPDVTVNPGPSTGSYQSPFFSVVFRTRPGIGKIGGGETTREFAPPIFALLLSERAEIARGITRTPEGVGR